MDTNADRHVRASPGVTNVTPQPTRRFGYLADPLFVFSLTLYCLCRWVLKPHHVGGWLVHDYLNDLLCLPLLVPIILRIQSQLRIRRHDRPPTVFELVHNWIVFSVVFELVIPRLPQFRSTADPWDVVAYLVGGLLGYVCWHWRGITSIAGDPQALGRQSVL